MRDVPGQMFLWDNTPERVTAQAVMELHATLEDSLAYRVGRMAGAMYEEREAEILRSLEKQD